MMRIVLGAVLALTLVADSNAAGAQQPFSFGLAAGASLPSGDYGELVSTGFHIQASGELSPVALPVGLRFDAAWNSFGLEDDVGEGDLRILSFTANAKLGFLAGLIAKPYVIGGVGLYNQDFTAAGNSESDFGFNFGLGIDFALAGFGTFGELRWHKVLVDAEGFDASYIPLTFGVRF